VEGRVLAFVSANVEDQPLEHRDHGGAGRERIPNEYTTVLQLPALDLLETESDRLAEFYRTIADTQLAGVDPWFYEYCGELRDHEGARRYLRHLHDRLAFAAVDPRGIRVLDAGCGFGFTLVALALLGAAEAKGVELYDRMVATIEAYDHLLPEEIRERIEVVKGSVSEMPYEPESFDLVVSNEAISHYRDVEPFLREVHRVLRRSGVLLVSDGNNGLNPWTRKKTHEIWDAFELGAGNGYVHGHVVKHRYRAERAEFVAQHFPDVPAERMARETFGMTFEEVAEACRRYRSDGSFPGSVYDRKTVPLNPDDGIVIERLFNPYALARQMRRLGFKTKTRGYWGGASGRPLLRIANRVLTPLSPLTIFSARGFLIAARKL
jgi:SAM-dependent methyltransferase